MKSTNVPLLIITMLCFSHAKILRKSYFLEITIGEKVCDVTTYGAKGDGKTNDTKAIQKALDDCGKSGGQVVIPAPGRYLVAALHITGSNTELHIAKGATLLASNDRSKWPEPWAIITAKKLHDIAITGGGVVDGQGKIWWEHRDDFRPHTVDFKDVTHALISDTTFLNPPNHCLELYSDYTELAGVSVLAPASEGSNPSHNTDAVDVHGSPFYVHDCNLDNGDDNIASHANDTLVENCYFGAGHGASIGSLCDRWITNNTFRNIIFNGTTNGARIKTHANCDGRVWNVKYENLTMYGVKTPIDINMFYTGDGPLKKTRMVIEDIFFTNIISHGQHYDGSIDCDPDSPCRSINLKHVHFDGGKEWNCHGGKGKDCFNKVTGTATDVEPPAFLNKSVLYHQ